MKEAGIGNLGLQDRERFQLKFFIHNAHRVLTGARNPRARCSSLDSEIHRSFWWRSRKGHNVRVSLYTSIMSTETKSEAVQVGRERRSDVSILADVRQPRRHRRSLPRRYHELRFSLFHPGRRRSSPCAERLQQLRRCCWMLELDGYAGLFEAGTCGEDPGGYGCVFRIVFVYGMFEGCFVVDRGVAYGCMRV